jgi:hypothetical protein
MLEGASVAAGSPSPVPVPTGADDATSWMAFTIAATSEFESDLE